MILLTRKLQHALATKDWRLVDEAYHMALNGQAELKREAIEHPWGGWPYSKEFDKWLADGLSSKVYSNPSPEQQK